MGRVFPRPIFRLERQHLSPLVGRDQELMTMRGHLFAAEDASREEAHKGTSGECVALDKPSAEIYREGKRKRISSTDG